MAVKVCIVMHITIQYADFVMVVTNDPFLHVLRAVTSLLEVLRGPSEFPTPFYLVLSLV